MIPTVSNSCCSLSLRTGSIVIGVVFLISSLLNMGYYNMESTDDKEGDKGGRLSRTGRTIVNAACLVACIIVLVGVFIRMGILLLIGAVAFLVLALLAVVIELLIFLDSGEMAYLFLQVIFTLIIIYCAVVLWSHGKELE